MTVLAIVEGLASPGHLRFAAKMVIEATTPPFASSFWCDVAAEAGVEVLDLVTTALSTDTYAWGSPSDFLVVLRDDVPVASCACYSARNGVLASPLRPAGLEPLLAMMNVPAKQLRRAVVVFDASWSTTDVSPFAIAPAPWIIENVGVDAGFRGQGLMSHLINAATDKGARLGHCAAGLSVVQGNDRAVNAYLRLGFEVSRTYGPHDFGSGEFPGLIKMRKLLRSGDDQQAPGEKAPWL